MVAAAVWALEQPLDKLAFSSHYDDVEILGKWITRGEGWYPAGLAWHLGNGALFGAVYSNLAPVLPLPALLRGPAVAAVQHAAFWPLSRVTDRVHPARKELPVLAGNQRAFLQGLARHVLFGLVLGELERRVNAAPETAPPGPDAGYSSNGHGSLEHAFTAG